MQMSREQKENAERQRSIRFWVLQQTLRQSYLLTAIFLMMFPFHGDSLKELEDRQREFYVQNPDGSGEIVDAPPVGIGSSGGNKIVPVDDNL